MKDEIVVYIKLEKKHQRDEISNWVKELEFCRWNGFYIDIGTGQKMIANGLWLTKEDAVAFRIIFG